MKLKIKRTLSALLCIIMLLSLFACGTEEQTKNTKETNDIARQTAATQGSSDPAETVTATGETDPADSFWKDFPTLFEFSSGIGGWSTELTINKDGSFTGKYIDSELSETGDSYPKGTIYICEFSGAFTEPEKYEETVYTAFLLGEITQEKEEGTEWIEDETRFVYSTPYGFENADIFYIYLPGTPASQVAEDFWRWAELDPTSATALPDDLYGIYNLNAAAGFVNR